MTKMQRYYEIKAQIRSLESELDELKKPIMEEIIEADAEKSGISTPFGVFKLKGSVKWEYSPELLAKEENIKLKIKTMKRDEEMSGAAKCIKDGYTLVFSFNKGV